jgi:hypothetical protein
VLVLGLALIGLLFYRSRKNASAPANNKDAAAAVATADAKTRELTPPPPQGDGAAGGGALAKKAADATVDPVPPYDELDGQAVATAKDKPAASGPRAVPYPGMHHELAGREMHTPADWRPGGDATAAAATASELPGQAAAARHAAGAAVGELPAQAARVELDGAVPQQRYEMAGSGVGGQPGWVELPTGPDS